MSFWGGTWIQNGINYNTINIDFLIEYTFLFLWETIVFVGGLLYYTYYAVFLHNLYFEIPHLEFIWTTLPAIVLLAVAVPSLELLYFIENKNLQDVTINVTGHQWYWSYDYYNIISFDSFLLSPDLGSPRLVEVDNHTVLPLGKTIAIVTSEDVIHSWSLPPLGVNVDANPGRLNAVTFNLLLPGIYFGQCSEICGANHSFIPIVVESVVLSIFKQWAVHMAGN